MSVDFNALLSQGSALSEAPRAAIAWRTILDKSESLVFKKPDGTVLAAQTVRVEGDSSASLSESAAGVAPKRRVVIFGIKGHATLADTDFKEGYRFILENDELRITDVIDTIGERQAIAEAAG